MKTIAFIKKHYVMIASILVVLIVFFGFYGFYQFAMLRGAIGSNICGMNIFTSVIYDTVRLFIGEWNIGYGNSLNIWIELARFSGLFLLGMTILIITATEAYQRIMLYRIKYFQTDLIVVIGLGTVGKAFVDSLVNLEKKQVLVVEKNPANPYVDSLKNRGIIVVIGDAVNDISEKGHNQNILEKACVKKAKNIIVATGRDQDNIEMYTRLLNYFEKNQLDFSSLRVHLHIVDHEIAKALDVNGFLNKEILNISVFNIYTSAARQLFKNHTIQGATNTIDKDAKPVELLILGFGELGKNILFQAAKIAHFANGKKLIVRIFDKNAVEEFQVFKAAHRGIENICEVDCREVDLKSYSFFMEFENGANNYSFVAVCMDDDEASIGVATALLTIKNKRDCEFILAVRLIDSHLTSNTFGGQNGVIAFGSIPEVCSYGYIIDEKLDEMAKTIHQKYIQKRTDGKQANPDWSSQSIFKKNSNRASAEHLKVKIETLGLSVDEVKQMETEEFEKKLSTESFSGYTESKLITLAKMEHQRWNAFHYLYGYEYSSDDKYLRKLGNDVDEINSMREKYLKHPCLASWDDLISVARKEGKECDDHYQENDKKNILVIPELFKQTEDRK